MKNKEQIPITVLIPLSTTGSTLITFLGDLVVSVTNNK